MKKKKVLPEDLIRILKDKASNEDVSPIFKAMVEGVLKTDKKRVLENLVIVENHESN